MAITLKQAEQAIANRLEFKAGANTLWASYDYEDGIYRIYSYRTMIGYIKNDGTWWITSHKYSQTTSRHTSRVRSGIISWLNNRGLDGMNLVLNQREAVRA